MGFWNVKARNLKFGDEVRLGHDTYWIVRDVDTGGASGRVAVLFVRHLAGESESAWDDFAPDEKVTVRRG